MIHHHLSHCHNLYHDHQNYNGDALRHSLMTFGVKFSASEVDDAFAEMKIDEVTTYLIALIDHHND